MSTQNGRSVGRRELLRGAGVAAGITLAAAPAQAQSRASVAEASLGPVATPTGRPPVGPQFVPPSAEVLALFGDVRPGTQIGRWTVMQVYGIWLGGVPVVMADESGQRFQVDVLRRDPSSGAQGIGNTRSLSIFLANRGDGATSTHEEQGLAVMALADALARHDRPSVSLPDSLLTLGERAALHPDGIHRLPA